MAGRSQPGLGFWSRKAPGLEVALGARAMPGQCWQSRASERYSRLTNRQGYTRQGRETMRAGKVYSYFGKNCKSPGVGHVLPHPFLTPGIAVLDNKLCEKNLVLLPVLTFCFGG